MCVASVIAVSNLESPTFLDQLLAPGNKFAFDSCRSRRGMSDRDGADELCRGISCKNLADSTESESSCTVRFQNDSRLLDAV